MNLLMFSGDASVARGRGGAFTEMLKRFSTHWSRIDILTPYAPDASDRVLYGNVYLHPSPWHRLWQPLFIRRKAGQLLSERPYDLMVSHDFGFFYNGIGAWMLKRHYPDMPLVSEIHHVEGYPLALSLREKAWRAVAMRYLPWASHHVTAFRVVNQQEVPALLRRLGIPSDKIIVLYSLYLDFDIFKPIPALKKYDVLFVGRFAANKGIDLLLNAIKLVKQTHPEIRVALRGEGELKAAIDTQIQTDGLAENVVFLPRVADSLELAAIYRASRMLVCASTVEGNPRVTIEAMACGVPVLSTHTGIMPEVIRDGENGFLFSRDAADLAAKIRLLLDNPDLQARIGTAGQQSVGRFDADTVITEYAQGYQALIKAYKNSAH